MLSKRERRIGVVTGIVLAALALDQLIVTPLLNRKNEAGGRIEIAQQELTRAQRLFQNDLRARRIWNEMAGASLHSDAPAAESQVLNRVREWAQEARLSVTALKPERNERVQGYQKITIRATATGSMQQMARFIYSVQTAAIPVRISDLQITTRREGTDDLSLNVGLSTIYLPPEPPRGMAAEVMR